MKKLLTVIAAAVFIVYPSICFASYVIHLKDGRNRSKKVSRPSTIFRTYGVNKGTPVPSSGATPVEWSYGI